MKKEPPTIYLADSPVHGPVYGAEDDPTPKDVFRQARAFLGRRYKGMVLFGLVGAVLAGFLAVNIQDLYRGTVYLLVQAPATSPIENDPLQAASHDAYVEGQGYIIASTEVLHEVVRREGLTAVPYFQRQPPTWLKQQVNALRKLILPDQPVEPEGGEIDIDPADAYAIRKLDESLMVRREGDSNVLRIDVSTDRPRLSARVANTLTDVFIENRERAQYETASRVAGWLDERELMLRAQLTEAEDAVAAFQIANDLITGEPGVTLNQQQLTELNTELITTRAELAQRRAAYQRAVEVLRIGGDVQSLPEVQNSEIVAELRTRLLDLELREADLNGFESPRLTALRQERARTTRQLETEVRRIVEVIANEVETLQARETLVLEALQQAGGGAGEASRTSVELRELERRAEAYRSLYERYLNSAGLAEESTSYLVSGFEVIDRAKVPEFPFYPPKKVLVLVGLLLGIGLGAVIALMRESMLAAYMTAGQVSRELGVRVIACVPRLGRRQDAFDLTSENPLSAYAEAVRTARHSLVDKIAAPKSKVILVSSAVPGEGKSSIAAALAGSVYAAGLRVLVIDADIRRAGLSRMFGLEEDEGLCELLRDRNWDFSRQRPGRADVSIIPAGKGVDSPSDLLAGRAMREYLQDARANFDLVLIDGPPVANMADASILADLADAIALVVRWKMTPRDVVREAVHRLPRDRVGVILNAVNVKEIARYGESYEQYVQAATRRRRGGIRAAA